ncbi:MAG: hypothetical protein AAGU74_06830 [Bacillota bacterium]
MILHLGANASVQTEEITAVIDADSMEKSAENRAFLAAAKEQGRYKPVNDQVKTYVLVEKKGSQTLYGSPISAITLLKRSQRFLEDGTENYFKQNANAHTKA